MTKILNICNQALVTLSTARCVVKQPGLIYLVLSRDIFAFLAAGTTTTSCRFFCIGLYQLYSLISANHSTLHAGFAASSSRLDCHYCLRSQCWPTLDLVKVNWPIIF